MKSVYAQREYAGVDSILIMSFTVGLFDTGLGEPPCEGTAFVFKLDVFLIRSVDKKSRSQGGRGHKADRHQVRDRQVDGFHGDLRVQVSYGSCYFPECIYQRNKFHFCETFFYYCT